MAVWALLILAVQAFGQETATSAPDAQQAFNKALAALTTRKSIEARLVESITISDQPLRMKGRYIEQGERSRLELSVKLAGGSEGTLLEVVDGEVLWNQTVIGESKQVTFRNLKQIADALKALPPQTSTTGLDLGLGGLSGLMKSLDSTMSFTQLRAEKDQEATLLVLQGTWKPEFLANWQSGGAKELPPFVPDALRLSLDAETLFPRRFLYLKRAGDQESLRPYVRLEFQDVKLDGEVDEAEFEFTPTEDLVPEDVTTLYIDQLKRRAAANSGDDKSQDSTGKK